MRGWWQRLWPWRRPAPPKAERTGRWGEEQAAAYLRRQGYRILGQRVRPGGRAEIDLVVRKDRTLAFVEVKTRSRAGWLRPLASVDRRKRRALVRAAALYLRRLRPHGLNSRFDVVEVIGHPGGPAPQISHLEDVFRSSPPARTAPARTRALPPTG